MSSRLLPLLALLVAACGSSPEPAPSPPNVLWLISEDQSAHYGPYGETLAKTPHVDRLAREGVKFEHAFVTAPVCSPARSALITGMYQTTIGAHHHRSGRSEKARIHLPAGVRLIPELMREAGYYVTNGRFEQVGGSELVTGKTDYNFVYPDDLYDGADWAGRAEGQPFFAQIQLRGGKNRDQRSLQDRPEVRSGGIDPAAVTLPPYYPGHPDLRKDWALYLESVEHVDWVVGQVLQRLAAEGDLDNTVIFFLTDHGVSHARGKQFLYEEGIRIPLIVRGPGIPPGEARDDLVAHIDVAATTLALAGVEIPAGMEARPLFGPDARPREYVVSARDRCDETVDQLRGVRTAGWKYIRNGYPHRPHLQPNRYKDDKAILKTIRALHREGKLHKHAEKMFGPRPEEELYDLAADPHELNNLAGDEAHAEKLAAMRAALESWIAESGDKGQTPEPSEMYDAEMAVYLKGSRNTEVLRRNIEQMKKWAAAGK